MVTPDRKRSRLPSNNAVEPLPPKRMQTLIVNADKENTLHHDHECADEDVWGVLRSINPQYETIYLTRKNGEDGVSTGYLLGRHAECDIKFNLKQISNRHCLIYPEHRKAFQDNNEEACVYIEDMSSNGTYINGKKLGRNKRHQLRSGDEIQLAVHNEKKEEWFDDRFFVFQLPCRCSAVGDDNSFSRHYELIKHLGEGNFASVKLAKHRETGSLHAVKIIDKYKFAGKSKMTAALQQEVGILMGIHHPCIIQVYGVFDEERYLFIILELARGGELFDYIISKRKLSEPEVRHIFFQLFHALKYLHDRGIAHRDLKPENVLFADKDLLHVKISDFGLAKLVGENSFMATLCGTPNYVAPEVLSPNNVRRYHKEVDMWSLGVMLYICLCGFPPFSEDLAPPALHVQILKGMYDMPSPYWDNISKEAKDLVRKLLTVSPSKRITVEEALEHPWMKMSMHSVNIPPPTEFLEGLYKAFPRSETVVMSNTPSSGESGSQPVLMSSGQSPTPNLHSSYTQLAPSSIYPSFEGGMSQALPSGSWDETLPDAVASLNSLVLDMDDPMQ
ncbi:uncharacterized protein VTP21DRAFT_3355 [Calcarisporiella thermophila]|uniref:uncharacterized protein n=1 Tax=Calcarisporiella thermophila TaxID=911321 RepID=UPI00374214B8